MIKKYENLSGYKLDIISQIWLQSNLDTHDFISPAYWTNNLDFVKESLSSALIYSYLYKNEIIGFIGLVDGYIAGIFILKNFRSLGIGTKLLDATKEQNDNLTLSVFKKNKQAVKFYQKNGFTVLQERVDIETNELEYLMGWNT